MFRSSRQHGLSAMTTLFIISILLSVSAQRPEQPAYAETSSSITIVNIIDTSQWHPSSPDPRGITYWLKHDTLMVTDSEVDETPIFTNGVNVWETTRAGEVSQTHTTMPFSKEPVAIDIAYDPTSGHFFISDDGKKLIFEVDIGGDERLGTGDDVTRSFSTLNFGSDDPEGLAYGLGKLFVSDGGGKRVYILNPGNDGIFTGEGDDSVKSFDTSVFGQHNPEGVDVDPDTQLLYIVSKRAKPQKVTVTTLDGTFVKDIDITALNPVAPSDVTVAPNSKDSSIKSLYITDRGVDNNIDPNENDGKIYEILLEEGASPDAPTGLSATAGDQQVRLSWNAVSDATSYNIKRSAVSGGPYDAIATATNTSYTDTGLNNGTTYYYVVTAQNSAGESGNSNEASATPQASQTGNMLINGSFEQDSNGDGSPDSWSKNSHFTRSNQIAAIDGSYVGRFYATGNINVTTK